MCPFRPFLLVENSVKAHQVKKKKKMSKNIANIRVRRRLMHVYPLHCPFALCGRGWVWKLGRCRSPACADKYFREKTLPRLSASVHSVPATLTHLHFEANRQTHSWRQVVLKGCSRQVTFPSAHCCYTSCSDFAQPSWKKSGRVRGKWTKRVSNV